MESPDRIDLETIWFILCLIVQGVSVVFLPKTQKAEKILAVCFGVLIIVLPVFILWTELELYNFWKREVPIFDNGQCAGFLAIASFSLLLIIFDFFIFIKSFYLEKIKSKKIYKGDNIFHFRQVTKSLNANSVLMGIIAVILSFAFFFKNYIMVVRCAQVQIVNDRFTFDVVAYLNVPNTGNHNFGTPEKFLSGVDEYCDITFCYSYDIYSYIDTQGETSSYSHKYTIYRQSDFNVLMKEIGKEEIQVETDNYFMLFPEKNDYYEKDLLYEPLNIFGKTLNYQKTEYVSILQKSSFNTLIVNDNIITENEWQNYREQTVVVINTAEIIPRECVRKYFTEYGFYNRYSELDNVNAGFSTIFSAILFLSISFMCISMAILSLKTLTDADKDKRRYAILNMLGVDKKGQCKILFKQIFSFFMFPIIIPMFFALFSLVFGVIDTFLVLGYVPILIYALGVIIPCVYMFIYVCYFIATYFLMRKITIKSVTTAKK